MLEHVQQKGSKAVAALENISGVVESQEEAQGERDCGLELLTLGIGPFCRACTERKQLGRRQGRSP